MKTVFLRFPSQEVFNTFDTENLILAELGPEETGEYLVNLLGEIPSNMQAYQIFPLTPNAIFA